MVKKVLIIFNLNILLYFILCYCFSIYLTQPNNKLKLEKPNELLKYNISDIEMRAKDSIVLHAWLVGNKKDSIVILLSGIKGNRLGQTDRALYYLNHNYSVLMLDLRATGESSGNFISFGWHEAKDLLETYQTLKKMNFRYIAAHGTSLGAATIIYTEKDTTHFNFVVLESCYDNIDNALKNRVERFHIPLLFYKPIQFFTSYRLNIKQSNLYPEKYIENIKCPIYMMAGTKEEQIKMNETKKLYQNIISKHKQLHWFKNAKHQDFYKFNRTEYTQNLDAFITSLEK